MSDTHRTRVEFVSDLRKLQDDVLRLGSMVSGQIARAIDALSSQNAELANDIIERDQEINDARWNIENDVLRLVATQSPIAGDLRRILASVHIATNLERMGDHAEGIARLTLRTVDEPLLKPLIDIPAMAEKTRALLNDALEAFVENDGERARAIAVRDDEVDELYEQVYADLLSFMIADPSTVTRATHLLWVAHNLERIGDRVTNICERVIFASTGRFEEVNPKDFGHRAAHMN